jgi:hypothetical protein
MWNGVDLFGPPVELTLENTSVTQNVLEGSPGISLQGGGLLTNLTVTHRHSDRAEPARPVRRMQVVAAYGDDSKP